VLLPRNDPDFHQDNAFVRMTATISVILNLIQDLF
jgi:hypothetical protein